MRNKVLTEITEKNKLKEEIREIRAGSKRMGERVRKLEQFEGMYRALEEEYEIVRGKY